MPVALHLDHVTDVALLHAAPDCGFGSVMFDASALDYADNVAATAAAADFCHAHGLWLEGELGAVGGKGGAHAPGVRTDPGEAVRLRRRDPGGHAGRRGRLQPRDDRPVGAARPRPDRRAARRRVPVPLVLHGSSGVPDDELARAVAGGLVKINIGTALNIAYTAAVRRILDGRAGRRRPAPGADRGPRCHGRRRSRPLLPCCTRRRCTVVPRE